MHNEGANSRIVFEMSKKIYHKNTIELRWKLEINFSYLLNLWSKNVIVKNLYCFQLEQCLNFTLCITHSQKMLNCFSSNSVLSFLRFSYSIQRFKLKYFSLKLYDSNLYCSSISYCIHNVKWLW